MILFEGILVADITRTVHPPVIPFPGTPTPIDELQSICATEVKMQALDWMWPGRFAFGKLGIIAGLPDEGKGQIFSYIAAMITTAGSWPCEEGRAPRGKVVLFTAEDDVGDTVVPRLASAGADLSQIHIIKMAVEAKTNKERMFSLVTDLGMLRRKIEAIGDVKLVLIDPISAYMGMKQIDSFRTSDVRSVLGPVTQLASELHVAFLGIMHFNKKTDVTNALLRISDSLAYGATARHVYATINDPENKRKLFVKAKNNLAKHDQQSLAYYFNTKKVGYDDRLQKDVEAPFVEWGLRPVDITSGEAIEAAASSKTPRQQESAAKFLREFLSGGPKTRKEVTEAAEANLISDATLRRAKEELEVKATKDAGKNAPWLWALPPRVKHWSD
jgi:putative DNA primase/helicase